MRTYERYKPSGIEWIGELPEHWQVQRLKYIAAANPSNIDKKSKEDEKEVLLCNYMDVYKNDFITEGIDFMKATASDAQIERFRLEAGDVLATKDSESPDDIGVAALVKQDFDDVVCGYHLTHIKPKQIKGEYLFRYLQSDVVKAYFETAANGITRYALGVDDFNSLVVPLPPPNEQSTIAAYLDRKTAEIDALIADKKRLLELYAEQKTAIINQAMTKGIDPNAKMKPSGVEWLGDVPEHWEVKKLKYVHRITSGGTPHTGNDNYYGGDIPWLRTLDLNNGVITECEIRITELALSDSSATMVPANSVLMAMYGGVGTIGKNGLLKFDSAINQAICAILPNEKTIPEYLHYFIQFYRPFWMVGAEGTRKDPNIGQEEIRNTNFIFPPKEEQKEIARYISTECALIDSKISKAEKLIALLTEYRTALISEVVTGKIKVVEP